MSVVWDQYLNCVAGGKDLSQKSEILFSLASSQDRTMLLALTRTEFLTTNTGWCRDCCLVSAAHSNHQDSSDSGKYFTNIPRENILLQI